MEPKNIVWQIASLRESHLVAADIKAMTFTLPQWQEPKAGQHYDLRLTAATGYQTQRSYSLASAPEQAGEIELGVQLLPDGEVSPYLWQLQPGGQIEMRGPIGGHFIWHYTMPGPLVVIGGGSGMVPLISMIRHHVHHLSERKVIFLASAKKLDRIPYREELEKYQAQGHISFVMTLTDEQPAGWTGYKRRIDQAMLRGNLKDVLTAMPLVYLCGPGSFAEAISDGLISLGINPHQIRIERFG